MTVAEIKNEVMFQTNNDTDDVGDYLPYLVNYINEGYDKLIYAFYGKHAGDEYIVLEKDKDEPELPEWSHRALCDYASYCIYRNGNGQKQSRGRAYLASFQEMINRFNNMSDEERQEYAGTGFEKKRYSKKFKNIPW